MTPFFTLFVLSHTSDNTTSQNIGGTDAWAVPHLKFWGTVPPVLPRSPPMHIGLSNNFIHQLISRQRNYRLWLLQLAEERAEFVEACNSTALLQV